MRKKSKNENSIKINKEKWIQKISDRKIGTVISIGILAVFLIFCVALISNKNSKKNITSPELARAMNYEQFVDGDDTIEGTENVKFSSFFLRDINEDGYAEKLKGTAKQIGKEDSLYMELIVQTAGYLKNAKIQVNGQNFYLQTALPKDDELKDNYIGNNIKEIEFNEISNGTQKLITGIIRSGDYSYSSSKASAIGNDTSKYSRDNNQIILTGIYVDENGNETPITKTIDLTVDWYGTTKTSLYGQNQTYRNLDSNIDEEKQTIKLNFSVIAEETAKELNISKSYVEGVIPELNGYAPTEVILVGNGAEFTYDETNRKFTIQKEATTDNAGVIINSVSRDNTYNIQVTYPLEAYQTLGTETVEIQIPIQAYYEGYNNPNTEFNNPYRSNIAKGTIIASYEKEPPQIDIGEKVIYATRFDVTVGKYMTSPFYRYVVSKQKPLKIYNGVSESEKDDTYLVTWYAFVGTEESTDGIIMKETKTGDAKENDQFIKADSTKEGMENVSSNVGIYFGNTINLLGEDGWIKVYNDETDELLMTFDKTNLSKYTSSNPYRYETPVKHIRIQTSQTTNEESIYVYNIKEIDDEYLTTSHTKEEFDNLKYIKSTLVGYIGDSYIDKKTNQANYEAPYSIADISISKNTISTQGTEEHEKITIQTRYNQSNNQIEWKNGSFLVKLPAEIIVAEINDITINNSNVELSSYELIKKDGNQFIKINTKNTNPQTYSITIDINLSPDPRIATTTKPIELYASNEEGSEYYYQSNDIYDVNDNLNIEEKVNKTTTSINLVSPNSLLTNQVASNFDEKGSIIISPEIADIKPIYAVVDGEENTASIGIQMKNNYASTISDVLILGKIPFSGNTYVISGKDLGSNFTTTMVNTGIEVPEELQGKVTVYYSENENPTKEVESAENGWKTSDQITDWDNIKTFLIDFNDYVMPQGKEYVFNYTVKIPNGLEFNKVAYSHHGVYFSLDTEQGKYKTQTEPNKLGFRIAEKYNLELSKYQTGKDKKVSGATYKITEEGKTEGKTAVTNSEGKLNISNLYAERTYTIQEIKVPTDYELNSEILKFIAHVDNEGNLTIEKTEGTTRGDFQVVKEEGQDYKVIVNVEDEAKAKIKIVKQEKQIQQKIQGVRYKITGSGLPESGRIITTNINGETNINGLSINHEYTLQEVKADGYYLASQIKFKIVNNNGTYEIQVIEGEVKESAVTEENSIPTGNLTLEDEKIPTYALEITKVKKTTQVTANTEQLIAQAEQAITSQVEVEVLSGAKFKLYKDNKEIGEYTTGQDGKITINNLYQYVEGKDENATYTLKEVLAPVGYSKVKDITFKVQAKEGILEFQAEDTTKRNYTVEENTIKLQIADSPSFRLIKRDGETSQVIPNVKFAIYNVENGEEPAKNSKGEILGTKETINGKEYYTVTTNENGEITADLQEGLYKAVEVQAPDKYDIEKSTYYFGIGASREGKKTPKIGWAKGIGGSSEDYINSIAETTDGGYIVGGKFISASIDLGNGVSLTNKGGSDGMIIKYSSIGEVEWAKGIGGFYGDEINSVTATSDGGYIAGGHFSNSSIDLGNGVSLSNKGSSGYTDGMIIKYSSIGEVEWAKGIGGSSHDYIKSVTDTTDGGYIVGGKFGSASIDLGNGVSLTNKGSDDGMIIKYSSTGEVEWAKGIGGSGNDHIKSVTATSDGGYIAGGEFGSASIDLGNGVSLTNKGNGDGMIIKYSSSGEVEWAKGIGGSNADSINSIAETTDGGYIAGGYFYSASIDLGNGVSITNKNSGYDDGMIIKYSSTGEVEWAKGIGESDYDYINSVIQTSDGGYIVGGYFISASIDLGNGVSLTNKGGSDGMIIKYSSIGEVEWAKGIGGSSYDYINSVTATTDGGYIVGGYFYSASIDLENGVSLTNKGSWDGMIIKIELEDVAEIVTKQAKGIGGSNSDYINSVVATTDRGYIVGGYFASKSIDLGNGVSLTNKGNDDGMIIKYSSSGEVEWAKGIGGSGNDHIKSVTATTDGGYIVGGYFYSASIDLGNGVRLTNKYNSDGMIIKYSSTGEVEWAKGIGGSSYDYINSVTATTDGGYIVGGEFYSESIDLENGVILTKKGYYDGMIIKYSSSGEVEWAKGIGGSTGSDYINSVTATTDGGYIAGGEFYSESINLGNGVSLNKKYSTDSDGMIIKYNSRGEAEWAKGIGGIGGSSDDAINSVTATTDGGYIAGGYFRSASIDLGNGVSLNKKYSDSDGMIIKYSSTGEVEWAKGIGESNDDRVNSVTATSDGGYIAGGYFYSASIDLGNGVSLTKKGSEDGMIIKYSSTGEVKWAKGIGGSSSDYINSVTATTDGGYIAGGYFHSASIELENGVSLSCKGSSDGMIIKITEEMGVPEVQELEVENNRKQFKITTAINEIDGVKGGIISGEDESAYEIVKYGDSNTKEIKMIPDENYEIIGITVNGQEYKFEKAEDGSYIMPVFTNIKEDKHIVVTYSLKDNKIIINKVDSETGEKLTGAKFKLDQIEERTEPEGIIGNLEANGTEYAEANKENEVVDVLGTLTNNGTQYFVEENGTYVPTNSKTYQTANGGTAGIQSSTANSYIPIDLTSKTGKYVVVVNAQITSESADKGYATITETQSAPSYSSSTGRIMQIYGTVAAKDYTSIALEGGNTYYLHLGYYKDGSVDTGADQIVFNSVKVYEATVTTYNFIENNGKYESNNQGKDNTVANSYIPIDLRSNTGKYNLVVNAQVSSDTADYGYATVTETQTAPSYNSSTGRLIYISGTSGENSTAKDYTTVLQGGKMYYLHMGYYKNGSTSNGDDKFTINSINVTLNDSELYHTEVETNSEGQAITQIPFGKYNITEIKAPEGYELNETPTVFEMRADHDHTLTISNQKSARIIVHHYIKGTTTKLAEDETATGKIGEKYTTEPHLDLQKYELEKDAEGKYILPENATGNYESGDNEVIYYYVEKEIPLTVHHYIEGTQNKVPLQDGSEAQDVTSKGKTGESYKTSAIPENELSDKYELSQTPTNSIGEYNGEEVIVTYYYKKVERNMLLTKYQQDGTTPLAGAKFTIENKTNTVNSNKDGNIYTTSAEGKIETTLEAGEYTVTEVEAPEGYVLPENATTDVSITKDTKEVQINLTNSKKQGKVIVHYYIEGTTDKVPLQNGSLAEGVTKTGAVGDIYITKEAENISNKYELVAVPENSSGNITEETTEVIYYYRLKEGKVIVHHYKENTTEALSADVITTGKIDEKYNTNVATNIPANYELVSIPEKATGTITLEDTIVTYYYRLKTPSIETQEITKTSTIQKITQVGQKIPYTITYTASIEQYIGNCVVTIVDKLPYEIDISEGKSSLAGGVYNETNKTITWTENIEGIDTFANGKKQISITKQIELTYKNLDVTQEKVTNTVTGKINLETPEKEETVTANKEIPAEFLISIKVNKVWEDSYNIYEKRPQSLILKIKNKTTGEEIVNRTITVSTENNYTFTNLEKYDESGNEIIYTADEEEANTGDLFNYEKQIGELTTIKGETDKKEITITNTITKIPGTVIVKYIDKNTGKEIADAMTKEGFVGEEFDISGDKKDITGYTLIEEPAEKTGTYTDETQTKIYYYAKNTKVIVKYLEKETNKILTPDAQYEINGYEGQEYKTEQKEIDGYTLIENTKNTEGTMAREAIEVIYYYAKNTKVIVKYIDKETGGAVTPEAQYEQIGYVGKNYDVEAKDIEGYTLIENTNNTKGTMTKEEIEVIYYYAKNTKVIVKYLEKDNTPDNIEDNIILASQEKIEGYVGKEYKTEKKDIENYTFVESTNNTEGNMTRDTIEVIYYYAQNTRATVQHIDRETGKILKQETTEGKVGDILKTNAEDFEGYVLVQSPEKPDVVMEKDEQIVKYYYAHISAGVIEKHIDDITGELLYSKEHKGNEGDKYIIPAKTIEGYDLATEDKEGNSKLPTNAEGKMTKEVIEVKYYYTKKASVKVEYIDKLTGEKLTEDVIINGHEEEDYETEQKDFENYELIKVPENATGKMEVTKNEDGTYKKETLVQYYYIKKSAGVIEKHIDISSNKVLAQETHSGKVGDEYNIPAREFNWYELVEKDKEGNSKLPTNSKGNMKEELIEVDYYYIRKAKVTVEYIDKQTGEKLDTEEIVGYEGDKYETEDKKFDNYDLIEIPSNKTGEIKDKDIQVKYYYTRRAEVEVQYLEKDSKNILAESENISGHVGDEYETKTKDIQYYKFVESTTNTKGSMEKDKITVIYYYEKQVFDLKVDKWISNVTMDGIVQGGKTISTKDELYKLDIHRNKTTTANVRITYKMRVSNVGEIEGKVDKLTEVIPTGYSFHQEDNKIQWESNSGILITTVLKDKTIKPGENQEIEITLRWNKGEDNFGQKENIVILSQISNPAGYKDIHKEDNISKASMLITVATGIDRNDKIVIIATIQILLAISVGLLVSYKKKEK